MSTTNSLELVGRGRTADVYAWDAGSVIKLFHPNRGRETAERERTVAQLVVGAGLPAPAPGEIVEVAGRVGIVFERVIGQSLLRSFVSKPWTLPASMRTFTDLHVAMHGTAGMGLASLKDRLHQTISDAASVPDDAKRRGLGALDELDDGDRVVHGDYHPDNVIMATTGPVIIDWITAARGDPHADVANTLLLLRLGALPPGGVGRMLLESARTFVHHTYRRGYLRRTDRLRAAIDAWRLPIATARLAMGIAEEREQLLSLIAAS